MAQQDPKIPGEDTEKSSFWEKLSAQNDASKRKGSLVKNSLVDAIVSQSEREAARKTEQNDTAKITNKYKSQKDSVEGIHSLSKTLLTLVVVVSLGAWVYFYAVLNENNYFYSKIGKENLTTELNHKKQYLNQISADKTDIDSFSKLLRVESLANQIVDLDLENPVLNYKRPQGEKVVSREDGEEPLYRTVNSSGQIIYLAEADILALENARNVRVEFTKNALDEIKAEAEELKSLPESSAEIETEFKQLTVMLADVDTKEADFPSAITKENYQAAQMIAQSILTKVKNLNLVNLVTDVKKQAAAIDITKADTATQAIVTKLKNIVTQISPESLNSFETALSEADSLDVDQITDNNIYQKVISITGTPSKKANDGDLAAAAMIAHNLGKVNIINKLKADRVSWSNVIDRIEKIARLGSDLERDPANTTYTDSRKDIDPDGKYVTFTNYTGKLDKGEIEIGGNALGKALYQDKNFTLLADLIDAFEGSKYFKEVDGFSFSKNKNRQDEYFAPIDFNLKIQNPGIADPLDVKQLSPRNTDGNQSNEAINLKTINNLDFSTGTPRVQSSVKTTEKAETQTVNPATQEVDRNANTPEIDVFKYLDLIFNAN